jgi:ribonuclease BN (tRNA processing enzyme)
MSSSRHHPLEFAFIGSGNAFARGRYWSSFLLNGRYLFDAPPTVVPHLNKMGLPLEDIEVVFISHFHGDHLFGLPFLLLEFAEATPRTKDLTIVGPRDIQERVEVITQAGFPNVTFKDAGYHLRYLEAADGREERLALEDDSLIFKALQVVHSSELECYGFRVQTGDRILAYSGDAALSDALVELADGADAFVVECSCWEGHCGPHLSPKDIVELRRRITPSTTFILTHLDAGQPDLGLEGVLTAEDFATFRL